MDKGTETTVRLLLVDNQEEDVKQFCQAARAHPGLEVIWRAKSAEDAIAYFRGEGVFADRTVHPLPEIVVVDPDVPNCERLGNLERRWRRLKIGVFTRAEKPECRAVAAGLGSHLFQEKSFEPAVLHRFLHWLTAMALEEKKQWNR